jgi:HSP20 family molecular chaperone IbpA
MAKHNESLQKREERSIEHVRERESIAPYVDIYENNNEVLLVADLPGVDKEHLKINIDRDQLTIEGTRTEEEMGNVLRSEYHNADYRRTFMMPSGIDMNKVAADLRQGVLWLHMPKSESARPKQIEVKVG